MKNIFEVSDEEKNRILNLHESATKNQYLREQHEDENLTQDDYNLQYYTPSASVNGDGKVEGFYNQSDNTLTLRKTYRTTDTIDIPIATNLEQDNPEIFSDDNTMSWIAELNDSMLSENFLYVPSIKIFDNQITKVWLKFGETDSGFKFIETIEDKK
jgi:hypothetical protein